MSLQKKIFRQKSYHYKNQLVNSCIMRIRYGQRSIKTINGYKLFIFKCMKDMITKNINNCINLIRNGTSSRECPTFDELLSDCYVVFETCLNKYKIRKNHSFYFYFNKSLSRYFYRLYKKEINMSCVELSEEITICHHGLRHNEMDYTQSFLEKLGLSEMEMLICKSKLQDEKKIDFLKNNPTCNDKLYNAALRHIKQIIIELQKQNKY